LSCGSVLPKSLVDHMDIGVSDEEEDEKDKKEDQLNSDDFSESDGE